MPTAIPKQLAYLAPVMADLAKFDPESLGDDNPDALNLVEAAVRARIRGISADEARTTVEEDSASLEQWMEQFGVDDLPAHYLYGALFGMTMFADFDELSR
jgi:hypothetical protein